MKSTLDQKLKQATLDMRKDIVELCHRNKDMKVHLGGAMSAVDILAVLYLRIMRHESEQEASKGHHDRFIMSKAHSVIAQYAALVQAGIMPPEELLKPLRGEESILFCHPKRNPAYGIEISGGSLGMGVGYASGLALALRHKQSDSIVYAMVGDGECNEGSVWEAAAFAGQHKLSNFVVIVDCNGLQVDGRVDDILGSGFNPLKWESFGFEVREVDGHDLAALEKVFERPFGAKPLAILAHTVKGRGIPFAENRFEWHDGFMSDELYEEALCALEVHREI